MAFAFTEPSSGSSAAFSLNLPLWRTINPLASGCAEALGPSAAVAAAEGGAPTSCPAASTTQPSAADPTANLLNSPALKMGWRDLCAVRAWYTMMPAAPDAKRCVDVHHLQKCSSANICKPTNQIAAARIIEPSAKLAIQSRRPVTAGS